MLLAFTISFCPLAPRPQKGSFPPDGSKVAVAAPGCTLAHSCPAGKTEGDVSSKSVFVSLWFSLSHLASQLRMLLATRNRKLN